MLMLTVFSVLTVAIAAAPTNHPGTTPDLTAIFTEAFKQVDTNGNGRIEISEFLAIFDKYDSNNEPKRKRANVIHDGKMSIDEYIQNTQVNKAFAQQVYKVIDSDNDGTIPRGDVSRIFKLYDTNSDGVINRHEFINEYLKIYRDVMQSLGITGPPM